MSRSPGPLPVRCDVAPTPCCAELPERHGRELVSMPLQRGLAGDAHGREERDAGRRCVPGRMSARARMGACAMTSRSIGALPPPGPGTRGRPPRPHGSGVEPPEDPWGERPSGRSSSTTGVPRSRACRGVRGPQLEACARDHPVRGAAGCGVAADPGGSATRAGAGTDLAPGSDPTGIRRWGATRSKMLGTRGPMRDAPIRHLARERARTVDAEARGFRHHLPATACQNG